VWQPMDLLGVTELSMERTWEVSAGEVKLGSMPPDRRVTRNFDKGGQTTSKSQHSNI